MQRVRKYRLALIVFLIFTLIFLGFFYLYKVQAGIPDSIKIYVDNTTELDFSVPIQADLDASAEVVNVSNATKKGDGEIHFSMKEPFVLESSKTGQYNMNLKLFGFITLKTVSVDVIDEVSVMPCGSAIGIHVKTNGLLVLGTGTVIGEDGLNYEPAYEVIQTGDYITGINGNVVENISELQEKLQEIKSNNATLSIRRNDLESQVSIPIIIGEDGIKKIGIWVREDTQGIGTLTFITDTGRFAALGHGITDSDTGLLLELQEGNIYNTEIIQIVKGSTGYPGEIMGMILESPAHLIGSIETNSNLGINGELKNQIDTSNYKYGCLDVGLRQEVKKGPATILCQLDKEIEEYEIEILEINRGSTDNKGLVIQITDERLIEKTGGIIQGMSGAPIIQNEKIVGAVTHVLVNDPTKGYGIFIEEMLN